MYSNSRHRVYSTQQSTQQQGMQDGAKVATVPQLYHSVLGDREKCRRTFREFVVYDQAQVYPEWILWYERQYK
ncbi:unnamed protein product [Amoebophrya sp. A25]|nr:unnamed protein product [Amoebophrya sp. A25]|eukprot:GSA25T00021817001.1